MLAPVTTLPHDRHPERLCQSYFLVKTVQIIEDQAAIDFHFDVAGCAETAIIGQTELI